MIIESYISSHSPDTPTATMQTRPEILFKVPGSAVRGVPPFLEAEHPITLSPGRERLVWHDGSAWRVGIPGWGDSYAEYVAHWPALDRLSVNAEYTLAAPNTDLEDVTLVPS